jgi:hypothetical protein
MGCLGGAYRYYGISGGAHGVIWVDTAQVELRSGRVYAPACSHSHCTMEVPLKRSDSEMFCWWSCLL